ncbi:ABC transporter ATP-binding protein [Chitinivibrio alkaliphilus]|uniref:ABC transporter, ATP-binding protein n=1 Tax=Chitinivibrio alkaliphilus ACht1 TaxID=1313304 RepID=U7DDG2_9BACT|nr:ABC transporter ATP-binding protein [Chitinivibrio alkaliphilus]ERP38926.1 ABC transporter, ATP-binding protein [Chitinivibrio alkaliphilus ACht1]
MKSKNPILEVRHLRKHFGPKVVLKDVSFSAQQGEILCVIGQSGHGKSVIMKNIMGLMKPDGGQILFKNRVIASPTTDSSTYDEVRQKFGLLFQGAALFDSMTVGENIGFSLRERTSLSEEAIEEKISLGLEMVGLENIQDLMPAELSGGMKSRVGLARAVALEPEIMLYDEPTSALDPIMSDKINDLILSLRDRLNMTSIVITHDMSSAYKIADSIAMLYNGKIIFHGSPAEIRASRNPYIQQFIRGQRKIYYALDSENKFEEQFSSDTIREHRDHQKLFRGIENLRVEPKIRKVTPP